MSRLIDADEFIKYAHKNLDICAGDLIGMIDEQPTAYDIDKVVEQLESEIELVVRDSLLHGIYIKKSRAIEIVKGGEQE